MASQMLGELLVLEVELMEPGGCVEKRGLSQMVALEDCCVTEEGHRGEDDTRSTGGRRAE